MDGWLYKVNGWVVRTSNYMIERLCQSLNEIMQHLLLSSSFQIVFDKF